jgi:hypothetical protein
MTSEEERPARRYKFARWVVMVVSVANVLTAAVTIVVIRTTPTNPELPIPINLFIAMGAALLTAAVMFLIAWKAGNQPANIAIALPIVCLGSNLIFGTLLEQLRVSASIPKAVNVLLSFLGAGFEILAAARFPRPLTPADISSNGTIWGRIRPLRAVLIFFLRAPAVWALAAIITILWATDLPVFNLVNNVVILLLVIIYLRIQHRSGDVETRKKVLWFFEYFLSILVIGVLGIAVHAVLPENRWENLRVVVSVFFTAAFRIVPLFCICMAVFYAGAISPALVIRKTFVYGVTAALLLFTYATVEALVVNVLVAKTGINDQFASALLGTVLALGFHPIKNRMEHGLKRFGPRATPPEPITP